VNRFARPSSIAQVSKFRQKIDSILPRAAGALQVPQGSFRARRVTPRRDGEGAATRIAGAVQTARTDRNLGAQSPTDAGAEYPSPGRAWWAVVILFLAYTISFVDRTILSLLVEPLRRDLHISDTEISLLQGLAFAIFYTTMGLPIAIWADRGSRRTIAAAGIFVWSLMTAACGLANTFGSYLRRVLGGRGGGGSKSGYLLAHRGSLPGKQAGTGSRTICFRRERRRGLALLIGGAVVAMATKMGSIDTPFGALRSWQVVFIVVGLPGILVALLALTIYEPRRALKAATPATPPGTFRLFLKAHKAAIGAHFIGFSICGLAFTGVSAWAPTFLIRHFVIPPRRPGKVWDLRS